jgi:hypothetical protein
MNKILNFNKSNNVQMLFDGKWHETTDSFSCTKMDRTEDIKFSPSGKKLAIASYTLGSIFIFDIYIDGNNISVLDYYEVKCNDYKSFHGIDWINENVIIISSRSSCLCPIVKLPLKNPNRIIKLKPVKMIENYMAGSSAVKVLNLDDNLIELFFSSSSLNIVSKHTLNKNTFEIIEENIILEKLSCPDAINISNDKKWIAISNHNKSNVLIYKNENINKNSVPSAILRSENLIFPHGLCFYNNNLFLTDAGSNNIFVFKNINGDWCGDISAEFSIEPMSIEDYNISKINPKEGGAKGLDIFGNILAITSGNCPLTFFSL